jgi:hypothetical protein
MRNKISTSTQDSLNLLERLCEEENIVWPIDYEVNNSGDEDLSETLGHWFGSDKWSRHGDTFVQFGQDGTGSMFLLWFYSGLAGEPPVVFMGSEGGACLVASNIDDFIKQLLSGKVFYQDSWLDPDEEDEDEIDWDNLRKISETRYGPDSMTPDQLQDIARKKHPDFVGWVDSNIDHQNA